MLSNKDSLSLACQPGKRKANQEAGVAGMPVIGMIHHTCKLVTCNL